MIALFWLIFETVSNFLDQVLFLYLVEKQLPDERSTLKKSAVALLVLGVSLNTLKYIKVSLVISFLVMFSLHLSYCLFFRKGSLWQRLFWPIVTRVTYMVLDFSISFFFTRIPGFNMQLMINQTPLRMMSMSFYMFISVVVFFCLAQIKPRSRSLPLGTNIVSYIMAVVCVAFAGFIVGSAADALDQDSAWAIAIVVGGFMLMTIAWLFISDSLASQYEKNFAMQTELQLAISEQNLAETLQELYEHLRGVRHDLRNQMQGVYGYAREQDYQGLMNHLDSMLAEVERGDFYTISAEPQLDALLSIKMQHAARLKIQTSHHFVAPAVLPLSSTDVCAIFGNILDNALEAAIDVAEDARYLDLVAEPADDMWRIRLENSCNGIYIPKSEQSLSLRRDSSRGIGLKRVQALAEKNGGFVVIEAGETSFAIEVFLPWTGIKLRIDN